MEENKRETEETWRETFLMDDNADYIEVGKWSANQTNKANHLVLKVFQL